MHDIQCLTILAADKTWREDNGKIGMAGIFDRFNLPQFPTQILPFGLYVRLGDVPAGRHAIVANALSEDTHAVIVSVTINLDMPEPQEVVQLHFPVPPMVLPSEGNYAIHLSVDGVQIGRQTFRATRIGAGK